MPAINITSLAAGPIALLQTTLTASDTIAYTEGVGMVLTLRNATAGALSPVITGSAATPVNVPRYGQAPVAGGLAVGSIADGAAVAIPLDTRSAWLQGNITITGGPGIVATLTRMS
jgi:hypothetical protein